MRFLTGCFAVLFSISTCFAANLHIHPKAEVESTKPGKEMMSTNFCEIEIINDSFTNVRVVGTYDDHSSIVFTIYPYEAPHYISLFYNFYCHEGMYLTIIAPLGTIYSDWTRVGTSIHVVPYLNKQVKAVASLRLQ